MVDVRTVPRSRTNPQYNEGALPDNLLPWQVGYRRIAGLGGLRGRSKDVPPEINGWWTNQSFHNYADYALSDGFERGLEELLALADGGRVAIMCSEAVWWRCHRRIIADYLIQRDIEVFHLMGAGKIDQATLTPAARFREGRITYPPDPQA